MRTATTAYCPARHNEDPAQTGPQANLIGTSDWSEEFGRVEVFVCSDCGAVFGLDRNGFFCPVPDDMVTEQTITNERIAEMLVKINVAGDDHFDVAYSWDEYDGATTAAQYAETDAAYVLNDGTVIEYDEPEHAFVARRES